MSIPLSGKNRIWGVGLILTLLIVFLPQAIGGGGGTSNACTLTSSCTGPIAFDKTIVTNDTTSNPNGVNSLTSILFSVIPNETMIINAICYQGCNVTSVTDSQGNIFHFIAEQRANVVNDTIDGYWTNPIFGQDQVTVNWSLANFNFFEIGLYKNSKGVGNVVATLSQATFTATITTDTSGVWVIGLAGTGSAVGDPNCQALGTTTPIFLIRVNSCSFIVPSGPSSGFISDNSTSLPNGFSITFGVFAVGQTCGPYVCLGMEFELLPTDIEPHIIPPIPYSINYAGTNTKPNALNQVLAPNTVYCTGLTTTGLVVADAGTHFLEVLGSYGGVSLNTTGLKLNVEVQISTTAPQITFGTGCVSANTVATIVFTTSGALGATNSYVASLAFQQTETSTMTYYAFVVIVTEGFTGHANFDQILNQPYSLGTISLKEIH